MSLPIFQIKRRNKNTNEEYSTNQKLNGLIDGELGYNYYDNSLWIGPYNETTGENYAILVNANHQINNSEWKNGTTSGPQLALHQYDSRSQNGYWLDINAIPTATDSQSGVITTGAQNFAGTKTFKNGLMVTNNAGTSNVAKIDTNGYIEGTLLKTTGATEVNSTSKVAIIKDGWIHYITPSNLIAGVTLAGSGLTQNGTTINHTNGITAGTIGGSSGEINYGNAIEIPQITYNNTGHITGATTTSVTIPLQTTITGNAGSADKVNNSLVIKLNSGTKEGTNLFTFDGSAAKTINITPGGIGASPLIGSTNLSTLASTITLGTGNGALINQNGGTYQQQIEIVDNSTAGDAVYIFKQSSNQGSTYKNLMTINDDGNIVATKFTGNLVGNADSATKAVQDGNGKNITETYATKTEVDTEISALETAIDGKANFETWDCMTKYTTWSRLCHVNFGISTEGCKFILNISATRHNVVYNDTFLITGHHSGNGKIIKIAGSNYSAGYKIRILSNINGNIYVELYDNLAISTSTTIQAVHCKLIPIFTGTITKYTDFTNGTTVPSGYSVVQEMTMTKDDIQGNLGGNATSATKATEDGNGNNIVDTYTTKTTYNAHTHQVSHKPTGTVSKPTFTGSAVNSSSPDTTNTETIYSITSVGTVPSFNVGVANRCLTFTWSAGSAPTRSEAITVPNTKHTHSVTASGSVSQPTFVGNKAVINTEGPK